MKPTRLGDVVKIHHGWAFSGTGFGTDSQLPQLVTPGNFEPAGGFVNKVKSFSGEFPSSFVFEPGDLIISMTDLSKEGATLGKPAIVPSGAVYLHNQRIGKVEILDESALDKNYLKAIFLTDEFHRQILSTATGSTVRHTSPSRIYEFCISLPELGVQRAIGELLGALDDKIAANRRVIEVSDQLIRGVVRRSPTTRLPLVEAFTFKFGEAFKGEYFSEPGTGRPLIRIRDLKSCRCKVWTKEIRRNEIIAEPGTLLVGMDAEFRATRWAGPAALVNQRVMRVSSPKYGNAVAMIALERPLSLIERSKVATTVIHLNKADLATETVAVPVDDRVAVVRSMVDPLYDRSVAASLENDSLARTRDELLPLLMNGRITVKDAEQAAEAVL